MANLEKEPLATMTLIASCDLRVVASEIEVEKAKPVNHGPTSTWTKKQEAGRGFNKVAFTRERGEFKKTVNHKQGALSVRADEGPARQPRGQDACSSRGCSWEAEGLPYRAEDYQREEGAKERRDPYLPGVLLRRTAGPSSLGEMRDRGMITGNTIAGESSGELRGAQGFHISLHAQRNRGNRYSTIPQGKAVGFDSFHQSTLERHGVSVVRISRVAPPGQTLLRVTSP